MSESRETEDRGPGVRRTLVAPDGARWEVWRCVPSATSKGLSEAFASGWLAFESDAGERRRFAPAPPDWRDLADERLVTMLDAARPARTSGAAPPLHPPGPGV